MAGWHSVATDEVPVNKPRLSRVASVGDGQSRLETRVVAASGGAPRG
jgi:hypothetical protein